jgi:excisionase family DNA binding protein
MPVLRNGERLPADPPPSQHREALPERLWTAENAARFLQVSTKTLRQLVYRQNLPCLRLGSRLRFVPADVLAWARQRREV